MITMDTGSLFALMSSTDPDHERIKAAFKATHRPYYVPAGIMAEITYLVENKIERNPLEATFP